MQYNIKQLRREKGMTQVELAEKAQISRVTLVFLEKGDKEATTKTLASIAKALGVPIGSLFSE